MKKISVHLLIITLSIIIPYFILTVYHGDSCSSTGGWIENNLVWGGALNRVAALVSMIILLTAIFTLFKVKKGRPFSMLVIILNIIFILSLYNLHLIPHYC